MRVITCLIARLGRRWSSHTLAKQLYNLNESLDPGDKILLFYYSTHEGSRAFNEDALYQVVSKYNSVISVSRRRLLMYLQTLEGLGPIRDLLGPTPAGVKNAAVILGSVVDADVLVFLGSDLVPFPGFTAQVRACHQGEDALVTGPYRFPPGWSGKGFWWRSMDGESRLLLRQIKRFRRWKSPGKTDVVFPGNISLSLNLARERPFDPALMGWEDADLAARLIHHDCKVLLDPNRVMELEPEDSIMGGYRKFWTSYLAMRVLRDKWRNREAMGPYPGGMFKNMKLKFRTTKFLASVDARLYGHSQAYSDLVHHLETRAGSLELGLAPDRKARWKTFWRQEFCGQKRKDLVQAVTQGGQPGAKLVYS